MRTSPNVGWVKRLKAGDSVAVVDNGQVVYHSWVRHITPTGFVSIKHPTDIGRGDLFYTNGYLRDSISGHRFLVDPAEVDVQGATKP